MNFFNAILLLCLLSVVNDMALSLQNGLARTPPMGWLSWQRFKCNIRCDVDPNNCIRDKLFMDMANILVSEGYRDIGYVQVNIDDCWMSKQRDPNGDLVPDPYRFPKGIKFLADFMHKKGLKLGIYEDFGRFTCMGYPGIVGHMQQDADMFAKWEVDMVKLDGCYSHPKDMDAGYTKMGDYLNKTNRPMIYACSWPYYQLTTGMEPKFDSISTHCNMWRTFHDIEDTWQSIERIIDFYGDNQEVWGRFIGPGQWNDPDMLVIGNWPLSLGQARAHFAVWCMIPAPLLMSNDLRTLPKHYKDILKNTKAIAVNQDPLGLPGKRIFKEYGFEIWQRPISPTAENSTSFALLFLNRDRISKQVKVALSELGLKDKRGYNLSRIFRNKEFGIFHPQDTIYFY